MMTDPTAATTPDDDLLLYHNNSTTPSRDDLLLNPHHFQTHTPQRNPTPLKDSLSNAKQKLSHARLRSQVDINVVDSIS